MSCSGIILGIWRQCREAAVNASQPTSKHGASHISVIRLGRHARWPCGIHPHCRLDQVRIVVANSVALRAHKPVPAQRHHHAGREDERQDERKEMCVCVCVCAACRRDHARRVGAAADNAQCALVREALAQLRQVHRVDALHAEPERHKHYQWSPTGRVGAGLGAPRIGAARRCSRRSDRVVRRAAQCAHSRQAHDAISCHVAAARRSTRSLTVSPLKETARNACAASCADQRSSHPPRTA